MRIVTFASSLGLLVAAATAGAAEPQIERAAEKSTSVRSAVAADDVEPTENDAEVTHASPTAGASGIKNLSSGGGRSVMRAARAATPSRLASPPTRVASSPVRKGFSTSSLRTAAIADVPLSVVKAPIKAAAKSSAGVKRLASRPERETTSAKLNSANVRN
jgi:hypothetical protein